MPTNLERLRTLTELVNELSIKMSDVGDKTSAEIESLKETVDILEKKVIKLEEELRVAKRK